MSFVNVLKGTLAQVNPFDKGKTYSSYNEPGTGFSDVKYTTVPKPAAATDPKISSLQAQIDAANKSAAESTSMFQKLQAQLAAQPKLPTYDTAAAYATAQKTATTAVDAVYQDKLSQYLQQEALGKKQQTQAELDAEAAISTGLQTATEDNATNRTRTAADEATNIEGTNTAEANTQESQGTAFDRARSALLTGVANSGLTTSGLGRNQEGQAISDRNTSEGNQTAGFDSSRKAIHTAATRTFDDLTTSDTRNTAAAATNTKQAKQNLQDYIDNADLANQAKRTELESGRQSEIAQATQSEYSRGVDAFIASLIGSGRSAQDIALARQVYA